MNDDGTEGKNYATNKKDFHDLFCFIGQCSKKMKFYVQLNMPPNSFTLTLFEIKHLKKTIFPFLFAMQINT
jgi:hypothetical protein